MRVLVDNCVPRKFARNVSAEEVTLARERGWHELKNGQLIAAAEADGFDVLLTTDKNLQFQQNLAGRTLSIVVLAPRLVFYESLLPLADKLAFVLSNLPRGVLIVIRPDEE